MGELYKKADTGLVVILIIIIVLFFFGGLINVSQRECRTNRECGSEAYCGSDFECHQFPAVQKTVIEYNLFWPAVIIGIAIVIVAIIFRWDKIKSRETKNVGEHTADIKSPEEAEEISEPYYKSNNIKTP